MRFRNRNRYEDVFSNTGDMNNDAMMKKLANIIDSTKQVTSQSNVVLYQPYEMRENTPKKG